MNWLDNAISFFSPLNGARRMRARMAIGLLDKVGSRRYDAAGHGRRVDDWKAGDTSANKETESSLSRLRARSRDLDRNNPYARRAVERIADNVVGTGIRLTSDKAQAKVKKAWAAWAESTECDFDGMLNFYGLQRLIARTVAESGEAIVRKRRTNGNEKSKIPIQLQVFEPDIIDSSRNYATLQTDNAGGYVIQGVEFTKDGKRYGYWLWDRYPSDSVYIQQDLTSKFVKAEDVIHVYNIERPGQVRGVPFGVSAFMRLKDFDDFEDAELVRQKIAACFSVFITESIDSTPITETSKKVELTEKVEPGSITRLSPGDQVSFSNPPTKDGIDGYSRQVLQGIAAGYGITYEALTGDMRQVNFSSGRMGWIEFQRTVSSYQNNMMIPMLCANVWTWFLDGAAVGMVYMKKDLFATWTAPRREMIDPAKEIAGMLAGVRAGFQDFGEAVTELGYDPETVLDRIEAHNKELDKRGIILDSDPRKTSAGGKAQVFGKPEPKDKKPAE